MEGIDFAPGEGFAHLYKPNNVRIPLVEKPDDEGVTVEPVSEEVPQANERVEYVTSHSPYEVLTEGAISTPTQPTVSDFSSETEEIFDFGSLTDRSILFDAQIWAESNYGRYMKSTAGAQGIAQFMPKTWEWAKEKGWIGEDADVYDNDSSLLAQRKYMEHLYDRRIMQQGGSEQERINRALASYNWGIGNVTKAVLRAREETGNDDDWINYAPTETKDYIKKIIDRASTNKESGYKSDYTWYT